MPFNSRSPESAFNDHSLFFAMFLEFFPPPRMRRRTPAIFKFDGNRFGNPLTDVLPCAEVFVLFLDPENFPCFRIAPRARPESRRRKRIELLQSDQSRILAVRCIAVGRKS